MANFCLIGVKTAQSRMDRPEAGEGAVLNSTSTALDISSRPLAIVIDLTPAAGNWVWSDDWGWLKCDARRQSRRRRGFLAPAPASKVMSPASSGLYGALLGRPAPPRRPLGSAVSQRVVKDQGMVLLVTPTPLRSLRILSRSLSTKANTVPIMSGPEKSLKSPRKLYFLI